MASLLRYQCHIGDNFRYSCPSRAACKGSFCFRKEPFKVECKHYACSIFAKLIRRIKSMRNDLVKYDDLAAVRHSNHNKSRSIAKTLQITQYNYDEITLANDFLFFDYLVVIFFLTHYNNYCMCDRMARSLLIWL